MGSQLRKAGTDHISMRNTYRTLTRSLNASKTPTLPRAHAKHQRHVARSSRTSRRLLQAHRAARRREAGHDRDRRGRRDVRLAAQGREQQEDHPLLRGRLRAHLHQLAADHGLLGRKR